MATRAGAAARGWAAVDRGTRTFWRAVGRPVDLADEHAWLRAPTSGPGRVGDAWLASEARHHRGRIVPDQPGAGLLVDMGELDGPGFDSARLHPAIREFYEHTSDWRLEVWVAWSPVFWPGGELVSRMFGQRLEQLALPMRPLDTALGMDSAVTPILDADGRQRSACWSRTVRATGDRAFSGAYSTRLLPGAARASVHVAFPLESGNVQVFLRPDHGPDGSLWLRSPGGGFGQDGAYVVVEDGGRTYAARAPIHESFHVFVDDEGVLRTDHDLRLWGASAVRLHYRLERRAPGRGARG